MYFHFADSAPSIETRNSIQDTIKKTGLWIDGSSQWLDMLIPIQVRVDCGVWSSLNAYKIFDSFKKGEVDVTKPIRITFVDDRTNSAEIGNVRRRWIEEGLKNGELNKTHHAVASLKLENYVAV